MDFNKIIIAGKTRKYTGLDATEMAMAKKLSGGGGGGGVTIVPFATGTDEEIVAMIQAAHAGTIDLQADGGWAVGDTRTISVSAFTISGAANPQQDVDIVITSFDDYMNCGCVMQFDFKNSLSEPIRWNRTNTNVGGYGASEMKTTTLPALLDALPIWLKENLIEFSCLASAGNTSTTIETVTGNKLALRSEIEIFGTRNKSAAGEGSQIQYYTTAGNRLKKKGKNGINGFWWERSPSISYNSLVCCVNESPAATDQNASTYTYIYVAPFGCL